MRLIDWTGGAIRAAVALGAVVALALSASLAFGQVGQLDVDAVEGFRIRGQVTMLGDIAFVSDVDSVEYDPAAAVRVTTDATTVILDVLNLSTLDDSDYEKAGPNLWVLTEAGKHRVVVWAFGPGDRVERKKVVVEIGDPPPPPLVMKLDAPAEVNEGDLFTVTLTTNHPITVDVSASASLQAPISARAGSFEVLALTDGVADGDITASLIAIYGETKAESKIIVRDIDTPEPEDLPIEGDGLRVLVIYESSGSNGLSAKQQSVLFSQQFRDYLNQVCVRGSDGTTGWRFLDADTSFSDSSNIWGKAIKKAGPYNGPKLLIANGKTGYSGPLPETLQSTRDLIKKHVSR